MPISTTPPSPPPIAAESAVVADIRTIDAATLDSWKHDTRVRWWIELGDQMLLVGENNELRSLVPKSKVRGEIETLDRDRLRLRALGCTHATTTLGHMIAQGGRWELREFAIGEATPVSTAVTDAHESEWRNVEANSVVASRYRPETSRGAPDPLILPIVNSINAPRWFDDVTTLAGWSRWTRGSELIPSRQWIEGQFNELGLTVEAPPFTIGNGPNQITVNNVVGTWTGTDLPDEWIVVGAHYDSLNEDDLSGIAPGAEDNASGCAGVIELARAILPFQPKRTIVFMCYAGEEQGLLGSAAHVQSLQSNGNLTKVKSVLIMDMIGYSADAQLEVLYESRSTWSPYLNRFAAAAATYVPTLGVMLSTNPFGSDHMPYLNAGKQTLLVIDNDWGIYPHYHSGSDTPQNMGPNAQAMGGAILKVNAAMLAELSGASAEVDVSDRIFQDTFDGTTP